MIIEMSLTPMLNTIARSAVAITAIAGVSVGGFFLDDRFVKAESLTKIIKGVNRSLEALYESQSNLAKKILISDKRARIRDIQMNSKKQDCGEMKWLCTKLEEDIKDIKVSK